MGWKFGRCDQNGRLDSKRCDEASLPSRQRVQGERCVRSLYPFPDAANRNDTRESLVHFSKPLTGIATINV